MVEERDERFARAIGAVLVVVRDGDAAPDEGPAVGHAAALLRAAGGDAVSLGADTVVAVYDVASVAARAATLLHLRTAGRVGSRRGAAWRAGLHVGDVLLSADGALAREAIEKTAALARLAPPGTTAVAAAAIPILGTLRDATFESFESDESGRDLYLIVPRLPEVAFRQRRAVVFAAGAAALAGVGGLTWITAGQRLERDDPEAITLGIGPFRSSGSEEVPAWMGAALRDGLNTHLTEMSGVQVYSDEFIDFVMSRERLSAIEAATQLGIEKMVSGTVLMVGGRVRVEAKIIDVTSGLVEGAYVTSGREEEFLTLETDLVLGLAGKLNLPLTAEDERRLAVQRTGDVEALRRLLDAEAQPAAPAPRRPVLDPPPPEPHSSGWPLPGPRAAWAAGAEAEYPAFLETYRQATEARDLVALAGLYVEFSAEQRGALERFFDSVQDLQVGIDRIETVVVGEEAVVSYTRRDDFVDVQTGRPQHLSVRVTKTLRQVDGRWRFSATR